mmetsp:Transcript_14680/g.29843  ORF Transcript_14680/g.29843 Transcript_14680/m.29843 type:complete len:107 (+) Transcript_14680:734-1054(+)
MEEHVPPRDQILLHSDHNGKEEGEADSNLPNDDGDDDGRNEEEEEEGEGNYWTDATVVDQNHAKWVGKVVAMSEQEILLKNLRAAWSILISDTIDANKRDPNKAMQ